MRFDSVFSPDVTSDFSPLRVFVVGSIDTYQQHISTRLPARCPCFPTCSHYAKQAIEKFGVIKGGYLAAARLCRCRPGMGGYDPVPQNEEERISSLTTWRRRLRSKRLPISWNFKRRRKARVNSGVRTFDLVLRFPNVLDYENVFPEKIQEIINILNSQSQTSFYRDSLAEVRSESCSERLFRVIGEVKLPYLQSKASFEKTLLEYCGTHLLGNRRNGTIFAATYKLTERQGVLPRTDATTCCFIGKCCFLGVIGTPIP